MISYKRLSYIILVLLLSNHAVAQSFLDSFRVYSEVAYLEEDDLKQALMITASDSFTANVNLVCYQMQNGGDSLLLYQKEALDVSFNKGVNSVLLSFKNNKGKKYIRPAFLDIIKTYGFTPPGVYHITIGMHNKRWGNDSIVIVQRFDSLLSKHSSLYKSISQLSAPRKGNNGNKFFNLFVSDMANDHKTGQDALGIFKHSKLRIERFCRKRGLSFQHHQLGQYLVIDFYKEEWFLGSYRIENNFQAINKLKQAADAFDPMTDESQGNYQSLTSQFREILKDDEKGKELQGSIAFSGNWGSGQEMYSQQDDNFYDVEGRVEFPIFGIPVQLEGYYTTQDKHRQAKASFLHFRYDAEKAKEQLTKLITSYNQKYAETLSRGEGYQKIYKEYLQKLESEKKNTLNSLTQNADLNSKLNQQNLNPTILQESLQKQLNLLSVKADDSIKSLVASGMDSSEAVNTIENAKESLKQHYQELLTVYQKVKSLQEKINHYQQMLDQYKTALYYDSALVYDQVHDLKNLEDLSYKDIAKRASGILPEGKVKNITTGLTQFDAGMFPQYLSSYTMAGQMMKGVNVGYDIGFADVGVTYGNTEYANGNDEVTTYKSYSGRLAFKPILGQKIGIIYYGYSPSRKLLNEYDFFKSADVSLPSFRNPVQIISVTYSGELTKYLSLNGEYAYSDEVGQSKEALKSLGIKDRSSYNVNLIGNIPHLPFNIEASYEKSGHAFENSTLPVLMSGTERLALTGRGDFFRSYLSVAVDYNYLLQGSLYSTGKNTRWGFLVRTNSRRLPNAYLSYKPFSTFRSFSDTLSIPQRPILGSVWVGRLNYQLKKAGHNWRFMLLYNQNNSEVDTFRYESSLFQASIIYSLGAMLLTLNGGYSKIDAAELPANSALNNNQFISAATSCPVMKNLTVTGGLDLAHSSIGWSRFGFSGGGIYSFKRMPLTLRANFRYSDYRLDILSGWRNQYIGSLQIIWRFKMKLSKKREG